MTKKRCAVCGDTCVTNVVFGWRRDSDGRTVNICMNCRAENKVNAESIDNYTTADTLYKAVNKRSTGARMSDYHRKTGSVFNGVKVNSRARGTRA